MFYFLTWLSSSTLFFPATLPIDRYIYAYTHTHRHTHAAGFYKCDYNKLRNSGQQSAPEKERERKEKKLAVAIKTLVIKMKCESRTNGNSHASSMLFFSYIVMAHSVRYQQNDSLSSRIFFRLREWAIARALRWLWYYWSNCSIMSIIIMW